MNWAQGNMTRQKHPILMEVIWSEFSNNWIISKKLGATAIWITPPVWNQWWNPEKNYTGYHGYWASHFEKVDPHYGNLEDYKNLSDALHRKGHVPDTGCSDQSCGGLYAV